MEIVGSKRCLKDNAVNLKLMLVVQSDDVANEVNVVEWNLCCLTKLVLPEEVNAVSKG